MTATLGRVVSLRSLNLFILFFSFYFVRLFLNLFEDSKRTTFRCLYKTISSFIYIQCIATFALAKFAHYTEVLFSFPFYYYWGKENCSIRPKTSLYRGSLYRGFTVNIEFVTNYPV